MRATSSLVPVTAYAQRTARRAVPTQAVAVRTTPERIDGPEAPGRARKAVRLRRWFSEDARDEERLAWLHQEWLNAHRSAVVAAYTAADRQPAGTLFDLAA